MRSHEIDAILMYQDDSDVLIAAGSLTLNDGTPANVAKFFFSNQTWSAVGSGSDIPGPVTAIRTNELNLSSIFVAGRSTDNSTPFLLHWDGLSWTALGEYDRIVYSADCF